MSGRSCKLYVGDLPQDITEREIEDAFNYYGRIRSLWVARRPAGFAFLEYDDPRDAEDALRAMDGKVLAGKRIRVEESHGRSRGGGRGGYGGGGGYSSAGYTRGGGGYGYGDDRCRACGRSGHFARDCPDRFGSGGGSRRSRSPTRSRSRSPVRSRSRSGSRSRSR